ncbi:MAG: HAMP domain-containing histidine kinase [Frankiales bacterium]|nr:HAMP domain-containing histidine kinase [Frankiales bacterium]
MTRPPRVLGRSLRRLDDRWRDLPLRTRLTTAAALSATLAIVAVVGVAYVAVRHELRGQIDSNLRQEASDVRLNVQGFIVTLDPSVGDIRGYVQAVDQQGHAAKSRADDPLLPVTARDRSIAAHGGHWFRDRRINDIHMRVITRRGAVPGIAVMVAVPLTAVDRQLHTLAAAFVVLALGGLALTALLSWAAVRRVTRPVRTLTETAEQIAATRDLTVRINAESNDELGRLASSFNTMLDALERSLGAQRQLVLDASHELRTPLASLRTNVEVLNDVDRLTLDQRRAVLEGIVTQLDELTGLVADVVELARGEAPASEHVDIAFDELVARAVERARRHWPTVTFFLTSAPVQLRGVVGRLDRAVANMLDNAGKFSPPDGRVWVDLTSDGSLTVADEGPGVPAEDLPHVFDRFYRADEARALPGSGLGLAIVQQVADGHGGSISLGNRDGGGAVATLRLPVLSTDDAIAAAPEEPVPVVVGAAPAPDGSEPVPMPVEESLFR